MTVNSKKKPGTVVECHQGPTMNPDTPGPVSDSRNAAASVTDAASADPVMRHEELAAQKDHYLRLAADFDNFKKRTRRDSEQQAAAEKEAFIRDLLPVLDNLERALASEQSTASTQLHQGVTMTLQQLGQLLHRHGIEAVEDVGRPFDPHRHEAVSVRHDPHQPDQIILEVTQRGYGRGDKVFRPAKVIVNDLSHSPGAHHAG
jgi:molecular chaperone GrpE